MEQITYGDILHEFVTQYPQIRVLDYRPAELPRTIIIWSQNNQIYLYHYEGMFKQGFIIGCAEQDSPKNDCAC